MKKTFISLIVTLVICAYTAQAQIATFSNGGKNAFYNIGGYSFLQKYFPFDGIQTAYLVSGPNPQNDFSFSASAPGGIVSFFENISSHIANSPINIQLMGNNVRKFGCVIYGLTTSGDDINEIINITATTNLRSVSTAVGSGNPFVGFNVTGNENEYLVSITASFQSPPNPAGFIGIQEIILGDNTPQNVALNFDGVVDYLSIPSTANNNLGNFSNFTVTCWIKPAQNQIPQSNPFPAENDIISKWNGSGAYPFVIRYLNNTQSDPARQNKIFVAIYDGTNWPQIISTTPLNDGKWHHVALVKTNTNGKITLYIDGVFNGDTNNTITSTTLNNTPLQIGSRGNGQNFFKGEIDEVRIWSVSKSSGEIQGEMFCKNLSTATGLRAVYNFNNGVPHGNNAQIAQIQDLSANANHGTLNNFTKTGDASNFVTGQVKYVSGALIGANNGSSWANGFDLLQDALTANPCNDLFDVYVAKGFSVYKPSINGNINDYFNIPAGMRIYGGFEGTEKSINQRNMALIHTTYKTTLTGDLGSNDTPFNFSTNRTDNSNIVVLTNGNNAVFDGFTVIGSQSYGLGTAGSSTILKNSRFVDNSLHGLFIPGNNTSVINCHALGNGSNGILVQNANTNFNNCLVANNGASGINFFIQTVNAQANFTNCTIAANGGSGIIASPFTDRTLTNSIVNSIIHNNVVEGIEIAGSGSVANTITYSLVQGVTTGTGNLNGITVNPQFVSPLGNTVRSDAGDYRLKDFSPCINVGNDAGVSPLDLDRNPRPKGGKTDMGAYESNVNMNEIISIINGNWENNSTWNLDRTPLQTDKVIMNGHTVTVTTPNAKAKNVEQKPSSDLKFNTGGSLMLHQ